MEYYQKFRASLPPPKKPREVSVFVLNIKGNKVIKQKTEKVFYEKNAGIAELKKDEVIDFYKRNHPDELEKVEKYFQLNSEEIRIDFENHFTQIENIYRPHIENLIKNRKVIDIKEKGIISFFIVFQAYRNHNNWNSAINFFKLKNQAKFEMFLDFKQFLSSPTELFDFINPIAQSHWTFYDVQIQIFPISDNPIIIRPEKIMVPLAPDLLLEIDLKKTAQDNTFCCLESRISKQKTIEFYRYTIENSSRDIVSSEKKILESIRTSKAFQIHREIIT